MVPTPTPTAIADFNACLSASKNLSAQWADIQPQVQARMVELCRPKPTGIVEYFEITEELAGGALYLQGRWGGYVKGVGTNLQTFQLGDYVCRQPHDHTDQWIVARQAFVRDYTYPG